MCNGTVPWHIPVKKLQIYQHICPAAFTWLQGFNELFIQYKAAVDNRYCKNHSYSFMRSIQTDLLALTTLNISFNADFNASIGWRV